MKTREFRASHVVCLTLTSVLLLILVASKSEAEDRAAIKNSTVPQPSRAVIESEGLTYVYEAMNIEQTMRNRHDFSDDTGKITISESDAMENILFQEKYTLTPGCDKFPAISRFPARAWAGPKWFVVACGSDEGHHQTIKAFIPGPDALDIRTTSLDFESSFPNLTYDSKHGFYTAKVYKHLLEPVGYGPIEYAAAYGLFIDNSAFTFAPVFGAPVEDFYFDYYKELKDRLKRRKAESVKDSGDEGESPLPGEYVGPMLTALIATENAKRICSEIAALESLGLTSQDLRAWRKKLVSAGYPDFNFNDCRGVAR